jgi:hypothetical protein
MLLLVGIVVPSYGQSPADEKIKVLLLGTAHLDNPGRDAINVNVPDVLTDQKQKELKKVRNAIKSFRPSKVGLEVEMNHQLAFDSLYK